MCLTPFPLLIVSGLTMLSSTRKIRTFFAPMSYCNASVTSSDGSVSLYLVAPSAGQNDFKMSLNLVMMGVLEERTRH